MREVEEFFVKTITPKIASEWMDKGYYVIKVKEGFKITKHEML